MSLNNIRIVDKIIDDAIEKRASDIHIRDVYGNCEIKYRIDGILEDFSIKNVRPNELIARIKVLSKMNVAMSRVSQDGAMNHKGYDLRVCSMPSVTGEFVVIRILNSSLDDISLRALGYSESSIEKLKKALTHKSGLILICGPTGSGKSTTLLSLLNLLNDDTKKIITIEDPVENKIESITQINVAENIGLGFSEILRSCLRLDPDILIVSEIRDELTAKIAIRASLTGHLVLATLHTNTAIEAFNRLCDMGVLKSLLLDAVAIITAQKLLNRLDDKRITKRLLIEESIYFNDEVREIFKNNHQNKDILDELEKIGYVNMEKDWNEKSNNL